MSRIAKWRNFAGDPQTLRDWLLVGTVRFPTDMAVDRSDSWIKRYRALTYIFGASYVLSRFALPERGLGYALLGLGSILGLVLLSAFYKAPKRNPCLEESEGFEVSVSILDSSQTTTGRDHGHLIVCEGWLLFEGTRASFAVTRGEALLKRDSPSINLQLEDRRWVLIECVFGDQRAALDQALALWSNEPPAPGEAILPPTDVHPIVHAELWSVFLIGALIGLAAGIFAAFFEVWWFAILAAVGAAGCVVAAFRAARQIQTALPKLLGTVESLASQASISPTRDSSEGRS